MAGSLTISTLSDGTNSTSATNCIQGSAKAWVNFNGSGGAIRGSYNVSSVTVNGTGVYTVNLTNAVADTNYSTQVTSTDGAYGTLAGGGTYTTTAVSVVSRTHTGTLENSATICVMINR